LRIVEAGFLKAECLPDDQPTVLKYWRFLSITLN